MNEVIPELTTPELVDSSAEVAELVRDPAPLRDPKSRWRTEEEEAVELEAVDIVSHEDMSPAIAAVPPNPPFPTPPPLAEEPEEPEELPGPRKSRLGETEMDMTPMVDVTFQLLIFFMITAAFALQKAKEIPKPEPTDPSSNAVQVVSDDAVDFVTVRIDEFDTFTVIDTNQDEDEAASVQDLYIKLRRAKTIESGGKTPTKLRVESHADSTYERVINALDAGNETGFAEIELARASEDAE